jgi:hypothetical protein
MKFTGWVLTATGRISFSRVGGEYGSHHAVVCNRAKAEKSYIFGVERRVSRDGPLPSAIMGWFGRTNSTHAFAFLRLEASALPVPVPGTDIPVWKPDNRGQLIGQVIVTVGFPRDTPSTAQFAREYRGLVRSSSDPFATESEVQAHGTGAEAALDEFWTELVASRSSGRDNVPAFARATIRLSRTGACEVEVDVGDIYGSESIAALRNGGLSDSDIAERPEGKAACAQIARHVFFFIRDLTHRHYHHSPHSDLATTIYPSSTADDETWRRETQYSLVRMAIAARRENNVVSYRQATGIVAYAEAFQRHLAMWSKSQTETVQCGQVFPYDFAPLKASMDASLGGLEADQGRTREAIIYTVGSFLAIFGAILGSGQIWRADEQFRSCSTLDCRSTAVFWSVTKSIVYHPWAWLLVSVLVAIFGLTLARRLLTSSKSSRAVRGGFSRAFDALMATANRRTKNELVAWSIGSAVGAIVVIVLLGLSYLFWIAAIASFRDAFIIPALG